MIVVHGVARYGRVDRVDGQHTATRFHHVFGLPIVPIGSEWIVHRDRLGAHGRACRLSWKSVFAAYVRWWCPAVAAALGVWIARGAGEALVPAAVVAVLLVTIALASLVLGGTHEPRARRRTALQRGVLGIALDPLRLPRDTAAVLLPILQERFDAMSGGRTAMDVAGDGAVSPEITANAFVVLRLLAAVRVGVGAEQALAASERMLDEPTPTALADAPYRVAPPVLVPGTRTPVLEAYLLAPRQWYGVGATLALWLWCVVQLPACGMTTRLCGESKEAIVRAGVKKLAYEAYPQWRSKHPAPRCPTVTELAEYGALPRDAFGERYLIRCDALPEGAVGVAVWSSGENRHDEGGAGDDITSWRQP